MGILKVDAITDLNDQPIYGPVLGTPQTPSGTTADFTGIPSWAKKITVMFNGISTNGTSPHQLQLGSGSITSTGYNSAVTMLNGSGSGLSTSTTGLLMAAPAASGDACIGVAVLTLMTGTTWTCHGTGYRTNNSGTYQFSGIITLSGTLDRIRLTTVNGTDTFDAGSFNVMWE